MDELIRQVVKVNCKVVILAITVAAIAVHQHKKIRQIEKKLERGCWQ